MSIYTITLKRELLSGGANDDDDDSRLKQSNWSEQLHGPAVEQQEKPGLGRSPAGRVEARGGAAAAAAAANELRLSEANWLDCLCGAQEGARRSKDKRPNNDYAKQAEGSSKDYDNKENQCGHSSECLEFRRKQLAQQERLLQEQANQIEHSVNVTLEVTADLKQPNRIVWFKNNRQLTSSEKPVFYARRRRSRVGGGGESSGGVSSSSVVRRTSSTCRRRRQAAGAQFEEEEERVEETQLTTTSRLDVDKEELVPKCRQESSEKGSKLTIHNLQDDDYGQYTCRLIGLLDGQQLNIHTQLKEDSKTASTASNNNNNKKRGGNFKLGAMDEVIEVKEGDLNIELGIQILPETSEDEELMSEEEKDEFIRNTTITWFKDDVKLNQTDPEVSKLFQFTYDQAEGFHRLIVRKASRETEGVYTCLVENESGTSSCSTQLVVGPGDKPKLTSRLQDVTVYVGQSLEFRIKSTGLPPIDSCQWFKDDELLIELAASSGESTTTTKSRSNERVSMSREEEQHGTREQDKVIIFRLCIDQLKLDDTGRYRCRIINEHGYDETDCFVKVLQEIIEEHEEVEEMIEETYRLGGGKKSTREEQEETVVEEQVEESKQERIKRQRQDDEGDGGRAPRFRRKLSDLTIDETTETDEHELIVSTERDRWSDSRDSLKIRWFVNDVEIVEETLTRRDRYEIQNFYEESTNEWLHKLVIKRRRRSSISSVTSESGEENRYTCKASNKFGEAETESRVRRGTGAGKRKPRFLRSLEDLETYVGETIVMKVAVDNSDDSCKLDDLRFLKDGKLIYSSKADGRRSSRTIETSSKSRIRVRTYEEIIEEVEEEETTTTRTRYTRRRSSAAGGGNKKRPARVFEVQVENVQVDQMGQWECQASNEAGESTCKADVEVFAEPRIVTDLAPEVRVGPGNEIRLTVEASGSPIPVYSWFKDGIGIAEEEDRVFTETKSTTTTSTTTTTTTSNKRRSSVTSLRSEDGVSISGETLIIKDARPEDEGVYACKIENRLGQVKSRDSKLTITGHGDDLNSAPKIIKDFSRDQIFQIDEGESVILKVLAEGHPRPSQHWYKDTEEVIERVTRFETEQDGQEYVLKIKRSEQSDSGSYKVVLRNDYGETESRTVEVRVNKISEETESQRRPSAPTIMLDSQDKVVGLGSNVSFDVQVGGHPKPLITWYRNGRRLTESSDGRVSFVEEETTTTIVEEEEDLATGKKKQTSRKETSTIHRLVITNVRESDEAIYSLKAENDLGSTKSSLVSLTVDKRKDAVDELSEKREKSKSEQQAIVEEEEEETTTTVTTTTRTEEHEDTVDDLERKTRRTSLIRSEEEELSGDEAAGGKKRTTKRTTTRTTRTTTTTTEEEEAEEAARKRREEASEREDQEEDSSRRSKRRTVVEEEEEEEEEALVKRRTKVAEETTEEEEKEEIIRRRKLREDAEERMDVDEEVEERREEKRQEEEEVIEEEEEETRKRNKRRQEETRRRSNDTRRQSGALLEETLETTETTEISKVKKTAPRLVSAPKEIVAGLGSTPELEVEVETTTTTTEEEEETTKITWLKNDQEIPARLLKDNHIEIIEKATSQPGIKKHVLRINSLRSSDAGAYKLRAENPQGKVETEPIEVSVDRSMRPGQRASITPADIKPEPEVCEPLAPQIVSVPEEIVAGAGSSPVIVAEVRGQPKPEIGWFKDGQPISDRDLRTGHLEIVDMPSEQPDVVKQALKIHDLKPADVAAYHVKAENPHGEVESEPTNLRIDRSMGPRDEPVVTQSEQVPMEVDEQVAATEETPRQAAKPATSQPLLLPTEEKLVKAPLGSNPVLEVPVKGGEPSKVEWLKDGRPVKEPADKHIELEELPDGTQRLHINEMRPSDEGVYTVKASDAAGDTVESAPIKLQAEQPLAARRPSRPATGEMAPEVVSMTEEVVAGPGSQPELEVVIRANPQAAVTWFKDGRPLTDRQLVDGHLEPTEEPVAGSPDCCKYVLKVDKLRATDTATYHVVAKNPLGTTESKPISLKLDRSMRPSETPQVSRVEPAPQQEQPADLAGTGGDDQLQQVAPQLVSMPEEVVAGLGSSPVLEAEIKAVPKAQVQWFKDGEPIPARLLRDGHVELIEQSTAVPGVTKHALKVNDLRPSDVAGYHLKAENPLGELVSEPVQLRLDRAMGARDEPLVKQAAEPSGAEAELAKDMAPRLISAAQEVVAGVGSSPVLEVEVQAKPEAKVSWLKDGEPIPARLLRDGHLEMVEKSSPIEGGPTKHSLRINNARPSDAAAYQLKAENPLGVAESEPIKLKVDRSMSSSEEPKVTPAAIDDAAQVAPQIVSVPEEIVAGVGSAPRIEAEVTGKPEPKITWLKDGQPISERDLRTGHLEIVNLPSELPDTVKQALQINDLRPADVAAYHIKAENPAGQVESEPTNMRIDRSMGPNDEPVVTGGVETPAKQSVDELPSKRRSVPADDSAAEEAPAMFAPKIVSVPDEVAAGSGGCPMIVAEVAGKPEPEIVWLKDGQPISERDLRTGHVEIVNLPTEQPDVTKQALKINNLRPMDVADYSIKARNPLGEVESQPTNVRLDRSMGPNDEPVVVGGVETPAKQSAEELASKRPSVPADDDAAMFAPKIVSMPDEVAAGSGSCPMIVAEVAGKPEPEVTWFKDGAPISERQLRDGHLEIVNLPTEMPDVTKQALKINSLRPMDAAAYHVKAKNPLGEVESQPTNMRLDRSMGPNEEPAVTGGVEPASKESAPEELPSKRRSVPADDDAAMFAPKIVSMPDEVAAGSGSCPMIVAEVAGKPEPEVTWFKDGAPIAERDLRTGHLEIVHLPTEQADVTKQALKINNLRPADVAAYHVKAKNPLGEVESQPTNMRIDRSLGPQDEPVVVGGVEAAEPTRADKLGGGDGPMVAPEIVSMPEEIVAGAGGSPAIVAEVTGKPLPQLTWLKDGQPISERLLREGHLEIEDLPTSQPDTVKQALKIHDMRPADVAAYHVKAVNPAGEAESQPTNVRIDRSMGPRDEPVVTGVDAAGPGKAQELASARPDDDQVAPRIVSMPEEVVAGTGSSPAMVAEVAGKPLPQLTWFKDGQPISERDLRTGHVEIEDLPTSQPDTVKQALKINNLRPMDVAAYHVRAENPLGEVESQPTNLRIDRSMDSRDEPVIVPAQEVATLEDTSGAPVPMDTAEPSSSSRKSSRAAEEPSSGKQFAPKIVSVPKEVVGALGSSPLLEVEVKSNPKAKVNWFKDGEPIPARLLRDGHLELREESTAVPDQTKFSLVVNDLRPSDVAAYHLRAENPLGEVESAPIKLRADRSMSRSDEPVVVKDEAPAEDQVAAKRGSTGDLAPQIVSVPEEIVAGSGSSPVIEAEIRGQPKPEISWFKDGQPISDRDLRTGHLEIVDLPSEQPDIVKQALKIHDLRPADVAAYHLKAENPLGEVESEPTNVRIDRSMGPREEPVVTQQEPAATMEQERPRPTTGDDEGRKPRLPQLVRNIKSPLGSSPVLDVEVLSDGGLPTKVEWLKDGQLVKETPDMHIELEELPDGTHKLHINNMKPDDQGVYTLRASNDAGVAESGPINLSAERRQSTVSRVMPPELAGEEVAKAQFAPEIINMTEEVVAGAGSHPCLEVEVKANPQAAVTWYKDGRPLTDRQLGGGHVTLAEEKSPYSPDVVKYVLKVDRFKPADAASYRLVAKNPLGTAESEPLLLKLDKLLEADEAPLVKQMVESSQPLVPGGAPGSGAADLTEFAPQVVSMTNEIVAGLGSRPVLEAEIKASPLPETTWFKDGRPITEAMLADGHLELVRERGPDGQTIKETLKINGLKPDDVGAYHVKAENPLGEVQSAPAQVRVDRDMGPNEDAQVTKAETPFSPEEAAASNKRPPVAPSIKRIPRKIVAPLGSRPTIEVQVEGVPKPEVVWFKDGRQVSDVRGHIALVELPDGTHRLTIANLKAVDQGDYTITATNEAGEVQSAPISLVIDAAMGPKDEPHVIDSTEPLPEQAAAGETLPSGSFAPKIVRVSDKVVGALGNTACVEVEVSALPEASVSWFKDGNQIPSRLIEEGQVQVSEQPLGDNTTRYTLQIDSLRPSDAGVYHIEAENPLGTAKSPSVAVTVRKSSIVPDEQEAAAAEQQRRRSSAAPQEDAKRKPLRAPVIKRVPRQVVANEGESPVLEVEVSGEPKPEIIWFKNGKRIERADAHYQMEELPEEGVYRLTVVEARTSDEATYTVQASNEAGTAESGPIELKVNATKAKAKPHDDSVADAAGFAPQVVSSTEEAVAGVGGSPVLEVVIKASPKAEVQWFKDGQPLSVADKRRVEVSEMRVDSETTKYVLKIKDLKPMDVAAYYLRAENPFGDVESAPSNVRIDRSMDADEAPLVSKTEAAPVGDDDDEKKRRLRAPVIKRMPRRIVAGVGSSPVIEIVVSGEPKPEVIWYKNGRRVTEVRNRISFEEGPDGVYKLCFTDLKTTDQAEYTVVATNEAGTVESGPISLVVDRTMGKRDEPFVQQASEVPIGNETLATTLDGPLEAPVILGLENQEALPGQTIKLEAEVLGYPKPQIKWLKDGDEVELNIINKVPDSNVHSLTLKNVNDLYDGVYSLEAKNEAGVARKDARVSVVEKLTPKMDNDAATFKPVEMEPVKRKAAPEEPHEKPFIKRGLKFSQVNQGRSIKFEVQIDGKFDELIWTKDGEQINVTTMDVDDDDVDNRDFVMADGPTKTAAATTNEVADDTTSTICPDDDDDQLERDALLTGDDLVSGKPKRRFPPKILMRPRNIVCGPGSRVAFEVRFSGEPTPVINWFKNGERITETSDGKVSIEEVSEDCVRLIIEDVQESDVGEYHLIAENSYGSERTVPVSLELDEDMVASDDLANTGHGTVTNETTPVPAGLTSADSPHDRPMKQGRAPRILARPKPVHTATGSKVAFDVQVSGEPEPIVNWFRDGRLITTTSDGHVIIEEHSNGYVRLMLSEITERDVGQYHVVAENKLGSVRTIPVSLTIDDETSEARDLVQLFEEISNINDQETRRKRGGRPPRILLRPKQVHTSPGQEVRLEVSVVGQTKPSIVWYKDGKRLVPDGKRVRIEQVTDDYQRLVISDTKESDAGEYSVSAENDFGVAMSESVKMSVSNETVVTEETTTTTTTTTSTTESFYDRYVADGTKDGDDSSADDNKRRRAPRFTMKPRNKKAPLGGKVDFEVRVSGEPKPDIVWYKNGRRIHTTSDGRVRVEEFSDGRSKLVIEDLEETDHGVYAAEAKNEWGSAKTDDVQLRVTQRTEVSERTEVSQRGTARVTTKTKRTRSHYTFSEERHGYVTLTINDAQLEHDGDYKLVVRNKWGEASTQAPLVVIPKVEPRSSAYSRDRSVGLGGEDSSTESGRDSRNRRTPFDELEDYGHELDRSIGVFGSESRYQSGEDTYLLQLRDTEFPLRLRKYLRFGARQSPSLRSNLMDAHWGAGARVTIRERRKFREVMDEEIDDEKRGLDVRPTPMRLQKEIGTCGQAAAKLEHLRVAAAERATRKSADGSRSGDGESDDTEMMPPFFREKLKDAVIEETGRGQQQEALFACLAAGEPQPEYTWFRNDIIITTDQPGNRIQIVSRPDGGSELHIHDPRLQDSGCYKCVARNVHGNVTSRARLRVATRPSRPEPPEYVSVTSREVFLQWRPPRDYDVNAAEILGYRLEMSQSSIGEQDSWSVLAADIGHEFYVVDDLTPATSYSFRLSARNKFGWSESSYSAYVTTGRDDSSAGARLAVPHEMRARQYVSDIVDPHLLRHCEDEKRPRGMRYQTEQNPVKLNGQDGQERLGDAYTLQAEIARGRFSLIAKAARKASAARQNSNEEANGADEADADDQVAVKAVLVDSMSAAQTKNEFDILRSLQHEKVVRLHGAYKDDDLFVFVLERLSGIDVLTYLSSFTSYNEDTVSKIITQVMDAIEYLHFRGMCLLELLPDNVVMTNGRSTSLKLVDFSSARFVPRTGARVPVNASQNIEYCPPEVIAGHEVSTASDVWCIGVLTYVLLSGFSPFKGDTGEEETRENVRLGRYKYDHIYANCTPEVTRFLINVFKKHSSKRPTIEQLYENKWLLPNEFMIRKRQQATFKTDKIVAFAEEFHKTKTEAELCPQRLVDLLAAKAAN